MRLEVEVEDFVLLVDLPPGSSPNVGQIVRLILPDEAHFIKEEL